MAPRRDPIGEMIGTTEPSPEVTYPIMGVQEHPLALMEAPLAIQGLYLLCTISCAIVYWKFVRCELKRGIFYQLPFALIFTSSAATFSISTGALFLADANVRQTHNVMRGFFAMCYYFGKLCLLEVVFATLHNRFAAFTPIKTPRNVYAITYLGRFFITIMFLVTVTITAFTIKYSIDSNDLYRHRSGVTIQNTIMQYQAHWDRVTLTYNCMLLLAALYYAHFSIYLLRRANKERQDNKEIKVFLGIVAAPLIIQGLFFVIVDSTSLSVGIGLPWSYINLAQTIIDTVTMSCALAGVIWVGVKREEWIPGVTEAGTSPHLRDILLEEQARQERLHSGK